MQYYICTFITASRLRWAFIIFREGSSPGLQESLRRKLMLFYCHGPLIDRRFICLQGKQNCCYVLLIESLANIDKFIESSSIHKITRD